MYYKTISTPSPQSHPCRSMPLNQQSLCNKSINISNIQLIQYTLRHSILLYIHWLSIHSYQGHNTQPIYRTLFTSQIVCEQLILSKNIQNSLSSQSNKHDFYTMNINYHNMLINQLMNIHVTVCIICSCLHPNIFKSSFKQNYLKSLKR